MTRARSLDRFLKQVEVADLLRDVLPIEGWLAASFALFRVQSYVRGAALQQRRMERASRRIDISMAKARASDGWPRTRRMSGFDSISTLGREIHFYLICWNAIRHSLGVIQKATRFPGVKTAIRPHRATFNEYTRMRDHLEHFHQRVDGTETRKMDHKGDFGNMSRTTYSFGGHRVDISIKSLRLLQRIVNDVESALKRDAWSVLCQKQSEVARRYVRDFEIDRQVPRVSADLRRRGVLPKSR